MCNSIGKPSGGYSGEATQKKHTISTANHNNCATHTCTETFVENVVICINVGGCCFCHIVERTPLAISHTQTYTYEYTDLKHTHIHLYEGTKLSARSFRHTHAHTHVRDYWEEWNS